MKEYDVVIVGAGLAGLQLARLLGRQGIRVLLVDQKSTLDQSIHTTGIFVRKTLEDFDIPEDCLGTPIRHVKLYSPSHRSIELSSPHDEFRIGRMGKLYSRFLDHSIWSGVDWMPQTRYSGHKQLKGSSVVNLDTPHGQQSVRARYLVGSDGASSRVARNLELDQNREWIIGVEEVFRDIHFDGPPRLHCFLDPQLAPGYLGWLAYDQQEAHVGVGGYASQFDPLTALQLFRKRLRWMLDLEKATLIERRGGRIPVGGVLRKIANPSGLLVGDAAGAVSPLTAGGLDPCMRLSTYASRVIVRYLETENPQCLKDYSGELFRARFISRLWMRRAFTQFRQPCVLELVVGLLRVPPLKGLAWHVFFGRGSFPELQDTMTPDAVSAT